MPETLVITPIGSLLSDKQLLNGRVQYQPFAQYQVPVDPQHKNDLHTGIITAVHSHPLHGLMVRIQPDANTLDLVAGWYVLNHHVKGWAVWETVEAVPAHMSDEHRYQGVVGNVYAGYGYINEMGGGDVRFLAKNVLGGVTLTKGMAVTYTTGVYTDCALTIVASGNAASEEAYTRMMDRKAAKTAAAQPAKDRAALRKERYAADLKVRAEREKANMAALAAKIETQKTAS